jgi:hypothetical protein
MDESTQKYKEESTIINKDEGTKIQEGGHKNIQV